MKYIISLCLALIIITIEIAIIIKKETLEIEKEKATLNYYQDVETLLDSLYISESDSIFKTNVGNRYLESKHKFDSLIINNK